ncbi:MAG: DUF72 domain-containing protein [Chloroflexi bacterium]|nr:DUF72 domain-containing protein [Chloroflexota bacterium]
MADILIGTCSWSNVGLKGTFYPSDIQDRDMIKYYAQHFRVVEVDSTYYHMPRYQNFKLWAERTPEGFIFDVKAYRELTKHDEDVEPSADTFRKFGSALEPLKEAGKLGVVLFQFPPWFRFSEKNIGYIRECKDQMPGYRLAVEFRHGSWLYPNAEAQTFRFLRENDLAFVSVDEPQFSGSTVPPVARATSEIAVVRFHGRNKDSWFKRGITVEQRFNYLYKQEELAEWVPKIKELALNTQQVHVLMNNCYHDYSVRNARDIAGLLGIGGQGPGVSNP